MPFHAQFPALRQDGLAGRFRSHKFSMLNSHAWGVAALKQDERCQSESRGSLQVVACNLFLITTGELLALRLSTKWWPSLS